MATLKRAAEDKSVPGRDVFQAMRTLEKAKLPVGLASLGFALGRLLCLRSPARSYTVSHACVDNYSAQAPFRC